VREGVKEGVMHAKQTILQIYEEKVGIVTEGGGGVREEVMHAKQTILQIYEEKVRIDPGVGEG